MTRRMREAEFDSRGAAVRRYSTDSASLDDRDLPGHPIVLRQRSGDRDPGSEHLRDDVAGDLAIGQAGFLEDLLTRAVVEEPVGEPELVDRRVDAGRPQVLSDARADPADPDAVLDRDDQPVVAGERDDALSGRG